VSIRVSRTIAAIAAVSILFANGALGAWAAPASVASRTTAIFDRGDFDGSTGSIELSVFDMALSAASCAVRTGAVQSPQTLTVIDYSKPSNQKRLWVFDLTKGELMYEDLVAHGQGSGEARSTLFSNEEDSHQSSLGLFVTDTTYVGTNGYSLRLDGLDAGVNDHARERAIVMHGAPYVSDAFVKAHGRLGRSWGCPAIRNDVAREIIDTIRGGGLVFAYYPDKEWLESSKFLGGCGE
jgi:L,D-transpeptidase catalytic domain